MATDEMIDQALPEILGFAEEKRKRIKCTCNHGLNHHAVEKDEYGTFVSNCEVCDCTLFISEKDLTNKKKK